ncbi:MAG: ribonuclease P protein component 1 [Thermoplasma acidophilum]|nr:ribonuclease P protein component 1 [Thermoplasma acidophilum]
MNFRETIARRSRNTSRIWDSKRALNEMIYLDEFTGMELSIVDSPNRSEVGRTGLVSFETKNMLEIDTGRRRIKIPKHLRKFRINGQFVDGDLINMRPEDRLREYRRILRDLRR